MPENCKSNIYKGGRLLKHFLLPRGDTHAIMRVFFLVNLDILTVLY